MTIADAMAVRRTAVSKMLSKLRREGLSSEDKAVIEEVFKRLTGEVTPTESSTETVNNNTEPRVIVLRRNRKK